MSAVTYDGVISADTCMKNRNAIVIVEDGHILPREPLSNPRRKNPVFKRFGERRGRRFAGSGRRRCCASTMVMRGETNGLESSSGTTRCDAIAVSLTTSASDANRRASFISYYKRNILYG